MQKPAFSEIKTWLIETRPGKLEELWARADGVRRECVGDEVYLRGLIEISNCCVRSCAYCGIRAGNREIKRYRMSDGEILECARQAVSFGYGTVVLQAGEDPAITQGRVKELVVRIKAETGLAVTLSLGERSPGELEDWKKAGADRYLLRFETSNRPLFEKIHPGLPGRPADRIGLLQELARLGYEVGSGVMVGIPGQSIDDLARDIELFGALDLDMIGVGPFIPHPSTPLGGCGVPPFPPEGGEALLQVPNDEHMTYKVIALSRLVCPYANIPSTTALASLNLAEGREWGLRRGANILMPNLTPPKYRVHYEIYPAKACVRETAEECQGCMKGRIESIGRNIGRGSGISPNLRRRQTRMSS